VTAGAGRTSGPGRLAHDLDALLRGAEGRGATDLARALVSVDEATDALIGAILGRADGVVR